MHFRFAPSGDPKKKYQSIDSDNKKCSCIFRIPHNEYIFLYILCSDNQKEFFQTYVMQPPRSWWLEGATSKPLMLSFPCARATSWRRLAVLILDFVVVFCETQFRIKVCCHTISLNFYWKWWTKIQGKRRRRINRTIVDCSIYIAVVRPIRWVFPLQYVECL